MSDNWCKKRRCVRGLIKCIQIVYFLFLTENMCIEDSETKSVWISRTQTNAFDLIEKAFVWMCAEYGQRFSLALHWCWWYGVILPNVTKLQEENDKIEFEKQSNAYIDVSTTSVCQFVWRFYATYNIGINIQNKEFFSPKEWMKKQHSIVLKIVRCTEFGCASVWHSALVCQRNVK